MGRPRTAHKDMPPGLRPSGGRWYWRPTDTATRAVCEQLAPGRGSIPAGADKAAARAWWAATVLPLLGAQEAPRREAGTLAELIDNYRKSQRWLDLAEPTRRDYTRELDRVTDKFGHMRYAASEAQAAAGDYFRKMHVANILDNWPSRITANHAVSALSGAFRGAMRAGLTEYNPCRGVERNSVPPRTRDVSWAEYAQLKAAAKSRRRPLIRVAILLERLTGMREADLLRLHKSQIVGGWLHLTPGKTERRTGRKLRIKITWALRRALDAAAKLNPRVSSLYVLANRQGQPYTTSGFQDLWQRVLKDSGLKDLHFNDLRARAGSDAQDRGQAGHELLGNSPAVFAKHYDRRGKKVSPSK